MAVNESFHQVTDGVALFGFNFVNTNEAVSFAHAIQNMPQQGLYSTAVKPANTNNVYQTMHHQNPRQRAPLPFQQQQAPQPSQQAPQQFQQPQQQQFQQQQASRPFSNQQRSPSSRQVNAPPMPPQASKPVPEMKRDDSFPQIQSLDQDQLDLLDDMASMTIPSVPSPPHSAEPQSPLAAALKQAKLRTASTPGPGSAPATPSPQRVTKASMPPQPSASAPAPPTPLVSNAPVTRPKPKPTPSEDLNPPIAHHSSSPSPTSTASVQQPSQSAMSSRVKSTGVSNPGVSGNLMDEMAKKIALRQASNQKTGSGENMNGGGVGKSGSNMNQGKDEKEALNQAVLPLKKSVEKVLNSDSDMDQTLEEVEMQMYNLSAANTKLTLNEGKSSAITFHKLLIMDIRAELNQMRQQIVSELREEFHKIVRDVLSDK